MGSVGFRLCRRTIQFLVMSTTSLVLRLIGPLFRRLRSLFYLYQVMLFRSFRVFFVFRLYRMRALRQVYRVGQGL